MGRSGQGRKHPRKAQERLEGRVKAYEREHAGRERYTRPGSRKK